VKKMIKRTADGDNKAEPVTLKVVAEYVGLAAGTTSSILNGAPQSLAIPQRTKDRVFAAARKLRYQPNPFAQALRAKRIAAVSGRTGPVAGSRALVFEGAEQFLLAVNAIRQAGLSVPGDVAVFSADDIPAVSFERPPSGA
jgi:DNA-binding LacI/PurR family transcriptional regulator